MINRGSIRIFKHRNQKQRIAQQSKVKVYEEKEGQKKEKYVEMDSLEDIKRAEANQSECKVKNKLNNV